MITSEIKHVILYLLAFRFSFSCELSVHIPCLFFYNADFFELISGGCLYIRVIIHCLL